MVVEMAAGGTSFVKTQRMQGFTAILTSAACEWFLMFLLLIDAILSYLLTKFASYCDLRAPCILCSRLEHILGSEKPEFYQNLLCNNHRSETSSLISCHIHSKVEDGHGMCDDCLLSFSTKTKSNPKTHRLLVGKLGLVLGGCDFQSSLLSKDLFPSSTSTKPCTCCGKLWKSGQNPQRTLELKSPGRAVLKPCIPLQHVPRQIHLNNRNNLKKIRDKFSGAVANGLEKRNIDTLSYVGYSELKLTSDSESEFPFSDDDDVVSVIHENNEVSSDPVAHCTSVIPPKCLLSDSNPAKPNNSSPNPISLLLDPCVEHNTSKHHDVKFLGSDVANDYSLGEINWQQATQKTLGSSLPELISLDVVSPSPDIFDISNEETEESKNKSCLSQSSFPAALSEHGTHPFVEVSPEKSVDVSQASDVELASIKNHKEDLKKISTRVETSIETNLIVNNPAHVSLKHENSSDTSKLPDTIKEVEVPGTISEQPTTEEVNGVKEDVKPLASQNFSPQGSNKSSVIPINHIHHPEKQAEASNSSETQVLQKSVSVESGLESLDGSNVIEIEGESLVDLLKRQIEYDKKCMGSLHKELEEERNAAAIAANEAMAMITRLQEEKAALHMEALHYLRMMEEQAEYDVDALEKANDLLAEKEKEVQDLEAELEYYKSNSTDELKMENISESSNLKGENITVQNVSVPHITNNKNNSYNSMITEVSKGNDEVVPAEIASLEFEEEKVYISQCLINLEKKLLQISGNGTYSTMPNGSPEIIGDNKSDKKGSSDGEGFQLNGQTEENDMSMKKNSDISNGSLSDEDGSVVSENDDSSLNKENNHSTSVGPKYSIGKQEVDLVALENEISDLNDRLEALEVDHVLLEHIMNTLRNGNGGLQFIQEIAHQLHELRKIGIKLRW